ncbi:MAG TPA: polysaccharide deacetylase [Candidatus Binatia bacterium]|nr:polysaccharide deacetylase [Candidatus Binatia bacterium]
MIKNPVPWPNGARVAVSFTWDLDADSLLHIMHPTDSHRRVATMSLMKYGPEVGVPRIVEMAKRYGVKMTFFTPGWSVERYPKAIETLLAGGHELAHHGYLHENPNERPPEEELYWLQRTSEAIRKASGRKPVGYRAPWFKYSEVTTDFLAQEGFLYDSTLMGDDVPYVLESAKGRIIELPFHWAMDDYPQYVQNDDLNYFMPIKAPNQAMEVWRAEFDAMWEHRGLWVTVWHPFNSGRLARCVAVANLIEHMQKKGGVWFATTEEIARHVQKVIADGTYAPRVDQVPYYREPIPELKRP